MFIASITLRFVRQYSVTHGFAGDEWYAFLIFAASGMVLVVAGANWVIFSLGLELMSLAIGLAGAVILWLGIIPEPLLRVIPSVVAALPEPG